MSDKPSSLLRQRFLKHIDKKWFLNDHSLKPISCVYVMVSFDFLCKNRDIVYVGSTTNLKARYGSHNIPAKIQATGNMNLMYFLPISEDYYKYEIKLIKKLKPLYNKQHKNGA